MIKDFIIVRNRIYRHLVKVKRSGINNNCPSKVKMIKKFRKYFFKICFASGTFALVFLIIASTTTSWVIVKTTDEIVVPENITKKFPTFQVNKLVLEMTYSFGLLSFCVTTHDIELKTTKKDCNSIAVFKEDLEKAALQDAMKFEVLAISFLTMSLGVAIVTSKIREGHIKNITCYIVMVFMFFSGTSAVTSLFMVATTLTESSSIVTYNILAHRGATSEIDLQKITLGSSYRIAVVAVVFIALALVFYIGDYKTERDTEDYNDTRNDYKLLPITRESILGVTEEN